MRSKEKYLAEFQLFWYDQAGYQFDYPSLAYHFKDGSVMSAFISPWYWDTLGIYIPKVSFTYEDENITLETPGFAPAANQEGKEVETYFMEWVEYLATKCNIDIRAKKVGEIIENVLTK